MTGQPYPHVALIVAAVSSPGQAGRHAKRNNGGDEADPSADKYSLDNQLQLCRQALEARPWWTCAGEVIIPGHSRTYHWLEDLYADCQEFAQIVQAIRGQEITVLVTAYDDRVWRTMVLEQQMIQLCLENGVQIADCADWREPVPPDQFRMKAIDKLVWSIKGYRSEAEVERWQERIQGSLHRRIIDKGLHGNWGRGAYGYDCSNPKEPPQPIPDQFRWVQWMGEQRARGASFATIADELNKRGVRTARGYRWGRQSVRYILNNDFYRGIVRWGDAEGEGAHQPAFDAATWERIQQVNRTQAKFGTRNHDHYEFSSLCACELCGCPMVHHRDYRSGRLYLECSNRARLSDGMALDCEPHSNSIRAEDLRRYVIEQLQQELSDPAAFVEARAAQHQETSTRRVEDIDAEIAEQRRRWQRWDEAFEAGAIDLGEMVQHRERLAEEIRQLEVERDRLRQERFARENLGRIATELQDVLDRLPDLPWEARRQAYLAIIERIYISQEAPRIRIAWR